MKFDLDNVLIIDIETRGLLDKLKSKDDLHVMSVAWKSDGEWKIKSTNKEEDITKVFENPNNTIVGHFFLGYDLPALKIMFPNINFQAKIIDSLSLSHYLFNDRLKHGLEDWGIEFGYEKVKISEEEWENLTYDKAVERCERDCLINALLWDKQLKLLRHLYDTDDEIHSPIARANFKIELQHIQENNKIKLDVELCKKNLAYLENIISQKEVELNSIMPSIKNIAVRRRPTKLYKADGKVSSVGEKWFNMTEQLKLPKDYDGEIHEVVSETPPNCQSTKQMKDFLFSKGWVPKIFKDGANGKVPQLRNDEKQLCSSIEELIKTVPELEALQGLSVAQHRAGYLKAFLSTMTEDGYVTASWSGMAKTWRVKHVKPIVNLPSNNSEYGDLVRSCLIAPKGKKLVNADMSSLEDKTKQCSIYPYSPEYVETLNTPGYDAHLAIGLAAGFLSQEEVDFFNWYKKEDRGMEDLPEIFKVYNDGELSEQFKKISKVRKSSKVVNYACIPVDNTEVLTTRGWKRYEDLLEGDNILSYNTEKDVIELDKINKLHFYEDAEVVEIKNKWWKIESTSNHRWYGNFRTGRGKSTRYENKFFTTEQIKTTYSILNSSVYVGGNLNITEDEASFLGWLLSDGYYKWSEDSSHKSTANGKKRFVKMCISQSKKKFFNEIKDLLDRMDAEYSINTNNSNTEVFTISSPFARKLLDKITFRKNKHEVDWEQVVINMDKPCLEKFFDAFFKGDGILIGRNNSKVISQNKGNISEAIKLAGYLLGNRVTSNGAVCEDISFSKVRHTTGQRLLKSISRNTNVFCLTTNNSTFIIKQNGFITITGNCTYSASPKKIAETADIPLKEAKILHQAYWDTNISIRQYTDSLTVKNVDNRNWIYNPFTKLWLLLTADHIKFSACNQNFGACVFDTFLWYLVQAGVKPIMTIHDELSWYINEGEEELTKNLVKDCVRKLNKVFNQPIQFESEPEFAKSYGDVH